MTTHEMSPASSVTFICTCGAIGAQSEMDAHIATVTREEADAMLADVWTLVCSAAEDRDYTNGELEKVISLCTAAAGKLRTLLGGGGADPIAAPRPNKVDKHRLDHGDYVRASGDVTCKVCGHVYYDHPVVVGFEWLRRACDGRLLKL